ncbi:flagellar basal body P-ring formation chaperone FlgA [Rheinheimera faecalis]|uniref:flagellar basal body P-ring formation chaperone FlgA n=1 Tax=Rheinheimera faecalis TaxID=2901141 RepID=UPI001E5B4C0A|nr:flagellar basal body P-ring formation chaperone FlgA [Rheinheimera faecalis]
MAKPLPILAGRQWFSQSQLAGLIGESLELRDFKVTGRKNILLEVCAELDEADVVRRLLQQTNLMNGSRRIDGFRFVSSKDICLDSPLSEVQLEHTAVRQKRMRVVLTTVEQKQIFAWVAADIKQRVAVARIELKQNQAVSEEDIDWQWIDAESAKSAKYLDRFLPDIRYVTKVELEQGSRLSLSDISQLLPVNTGDQVTVQMENGAVRIQAVARALAPGYLGQRVSILVEQALRPVEAKVIGIGQVKI